MEMFGFWIDNFRNWTDYDKAEISSVWYVVNMLCHPSYALHNFSVPTWFVFIDICVVHPCFCGVSIGGVWIKQQYDVTLENMYLHLINIK